MSREEQKIVWLGEKRTMKNGLKATIINYRLVHDLDVRFGDDVVVTHKKYSRFIVD